MRPLLFCSSIFWKETTEKSKDLCKDRWNPWGEGAGKNQHEEPGHKLGAFSSIFPHCIGHRVTSWHKVTFFSCLSQAALPSSNVSTCQRSEAKRPDL